MMSGLLTSVNERIVTKILLQELPELTVNSILFHKARADRCVSEVNDQLILKFPLCEESLEGMFREWWLVGSLQGHTSMPVPVPVFVAQSSICFGYRKIPGALLTDDYYRTLTTRQKQDFAVAIARFLCELHGTLSVSEAIAAGLRFPDDPLSAAQLRQRLLPLLHQREQIALVEQILGLYKQIEFVSDTPVVLHGDLHGWNMVLNPVSNQLAGVFDFNGACIGDRHLDFRYFFCLDTSLQDAITAHYRNLSGQGLSTSRCILYGAATDLSDLVYCTEENMPIVDGPISARIARLIQNLNMYGLL